MTHHLLAQQLTLPGETTPYVGPLGSQKITLGILLTNILHYIFPIAGIILLIMILSAGFTLLTSAGDAKKMEKGKQTLTNGVIGFILVFVAYWLTQLVGIIFGVDAITTIFK